MTQRLHAIERHHDDGAARAFVGGMFVYAVLMVCLFALPGAELLPDLLTPLGLR